MIYSITFQGRQCLVEARSPEAAEKFAREEFGRRNGPYTVQQASSEDQAWVFAMGGTILNLQEN